MLIGFETFYLIDSRDGQDKKDKIRVMSGIPQGSILVPIFIIV